MTTRVLDRIDPDFSTAFTQMVARPKLQDLFGRIPVLRWFVKRDGAQLFDLVQGFVRSQVLMALVELDLPQKLLAGPITARDLATGSELDDDRMDILLKAGVAIGLFRHRAGRYRLTRHGAALVGVPGLQQMILHHRALYRDMADPVALLRGETQTELATFWPYVFGPEGANDPDQAKRYSDLMADTQRMIARDTVQMVEMRNFKRILDIGGGSGAFCIALAERDPYARFDVVDLPAVAADAEARIAAAGLSDRITFHGASFMHDPLPPGADAVTLIRVLYDHSDATVEALLRKVHAYLPPRGSLVISEPMSGGDQPDAVTDVYFAFYTLAMRTGRTRSAQEIAAMCRAAGFEQVQTHSPVRSYVTGAVTAVKAG